MSGNRTVCTLNANACDSALTLSQGGLVVTTNKICDFHRAVHGTLPFATGTLGFECYFYSQSQPAAGLANLCSVGVAAANTPTNEYVGGLSTSYGFRPSDGAGNAGIYTNNVLQTAFQQKPERHCIGILLVNDPVTPIMAVHLDGNYLGQVNLTAGVFYVPSVSIGSSASATDVAAYLNFGQHNLDYPIMTVFK